MGVNKRKNYKYGLVLLTDDKDAMEKIGVKSGIYVAIECPVDIFHKILGQNWLDKWLDGSKQALKEKLFKEKLLRDD